MIFWNGYGIYRAGIKRFGLGKEFFFARDWSEFGQGYTVLFWVRRLKNYPRGFGYIHIFYCGPCSLFFFFTFLH